MIQFYFLSIVLNLLAGYTIIQERIESTETDPWYSFNSDTFRLILGVGSLVIGLLKLFFSYSTNPPIFGDLIPALAGLLCGFMLIFEFYLSRTSIASEQSEKIALLLLGKQKWIGGLAIVSGVLHFLFPQALFL